VQIQPHRVSDGMVLCCGPHIWAGAAGVVGAVFWRTPNMSSCVLLMF